MRFVTYDRRGQRRLGAIFEGEVVDLPDAVGHPAFPTTLEGLVSSSRGTVMDAARTALDRDDVFDWRVKRPRVLTPLFPASLLSPGSLDVERRVIGPEQDVPWPDGAAWLEYEPKVAGVLGLETSDSEPFDPARHLFGYTLVSDWQARDASGAPVAHADGVAIAIGPCVVTADEVDPQVMYLQVKIDGEEIAKGNLNGTARSLNRTIEESSRISPLGRGDALALNPFRQPPSEVWPGAEVVLSAEGIGTLRNRVAAIP
ncbi:MAG TPA: fumarylacetoacetate hydrolase family protein [Actinomycetota bacterium]|nr:fumarylacetoacetate hydrolase family protein [Actinomycetota bacterium]